MSIFDVVRLGIKRFLRVPVRQTEAYMRALKDGTFSNRAVGATAAALPCFATFVNSSSRGDVLILDYALPSPDRDAGSRTVFEHIVSLADLGHRVYFWPYDGLDVPRYARPLRCLGVNVVAGYFRPSLKNWLAARPGIIRHVLLNRPEVAEVYLETLRAAGLAVVYYGHDLHHARLGMEADRSGDSGMARRAEEMLQRERTIWRRVGLSTYPSSEEIERVTALEPQVTAQPLLAFCFDTFQPRHSAPGGAQIMFVGNFRHPPNVSAAKWLVRGILPLVRQRVPEAHLVIAGAYATDVVKALAGEAVRVAGWLSDADLVALYAASRVAVVPLLVGAGVKLKVVEALHKGIPLVTTTIGAQGLEGLADVVPIHDDAPTLAEAVAAMLRRDDAAWLEQSHRQLDYVRDHYSRDAMKRALTEMLELAARTKPLE